MSYVSIQPVFSNHSNPPFIIVSVAGVKKGHEFEDDVTIDEHYKIHRNN